MNTEQLNQKLNEDKNNILELPVRYNDNNVMVIYYHGDNRHELKDGFYSVKKTDNTKIYVYLIVKKSEKEYFSVHKCFQDLISKEEGKIILYKK